VEVELLVVADCPNRNRAARLVRGVLDELGLNEIPVPVRVVQNEADARQRGFSGSPTVLIDGIDPFDLPGAARHRRPDLPDPRWADRAA